MLQPIDLNNPDRQNTMNLFHETINIIDIPTNS